MMFTPTKWTHHFGVFAGLAGSLGALAAVAVTAAAMKSRRNRAMFTAAVLFVMALSFATVNGWWYVSNFGVPWSNQFPEWQVRLHHHPARPVGASPCWSRRGSTSPAATTADRPHAPRGRESRQAPLAIAAWAAGDLRGGVADAGDDRAVPGVDASAGPTSRRSPARRAAWPTTCWSNRTRTPGCCTPIDVPVGEALGAVTAEGFGPNGIPADVSADPVMEHAGQRQLRRHRRPARSPAARRAPRAAPPPRRASTARAPGCRTASTRPHAGDGQLARRHPAARRAALGLVPAARRADRARARCSWSPPPAGSIPARSPCSGPPTSRPRDEPGGGIGFGDVGAAPAWRNLRAPLSAIPPEATQVRLVATDDDLVPQHWIAITPPRIPQLRTLQDVVGSQDPVLLDWLVGLAFPCQRPFGHQYGVTEVPKWRILPDRFGAEANSPVMDYLGGGPLGITELLLRADHGADLSEGRLVPRLGRAAAAHAVLPERRSRPGSIWAPRPAAGCGARRRCGRADGSPHGAAARHSRRLTSSLVPTATARLDRRRRGHRRAPAVRADPAAAGQADHRHHPVAAGARRRRTDQRRHRAAGVRRAAGTRRLDPLPGRRRPCPPAGGLVFSTIPPAASTPAATGCSSRANADVVVVAFRDSVAAVAPRPAVASGACSTLHIWANVGGVGADFVGIPGATGTLAPEKKPQVAGVFTDLKVAAAAGPVRAHRRRHPVHHRRRRALKIGADGARRACVIASIVALAVLDRRVGPTGPRRVAPVLAGRASRPGWPTSASSATLLLWHVIGATSSDDGYNLTIARVSGEAGYIANYYRFFGATEAPFDWYQSVLAHLAAISTAGRVDAAARHRWRASAPG